ncbi:retrovirus-related pol polyprotein from transposon TNT 1-94, partial [Tanacetum coccineum]
QEYLNDLEEEYQARALLAKSKRFFKKGTQRFSSAKATDQTECHKCGKKGHFARDYWLKTLVSTYQSPFQPKPLSSSQHKPELRPTKDFEAKYNKVKAKLALLSSSSSASKASMVKNKGLIAEVYEWDKQEVSSDDNEMVEVKVLMVLAEENYVVNKEGARNGKWVKISIRKHVNTEILKENKNLRTELKELKAITETWLNSFNKVNQCISEQIPPQKKRILRVDQLTEDSSSSGLKDLVFVKSSTDKTKVTIPGVERPWLSEAEGFILPNHDSGRILPSESQRNITDPSIAVTDSSATDYDLAGESSVCSTLFPLLKKLDGVEPISGPKSIKSILRSKSTFKAEALKSVIINEPSSAPAKGNKSSSASKVNSAPAGKLKSVKIKDDPPLAIVIKELNDLKLQISKNQSSYSRNNQQCDIREAHLGPKVVFGDDSTCTTEGYGSIKFYIHNHKDYLGTFDEKADDGYLLGYSLVSKAFRVFNTRRQQTKETYHIIFDESPDAIKFSKPSVDNINIAENERYLTKEYLHPYEPSQRAGMLTRAMAKELGAASAHECLFVDFLSEKDPKKVFRNKRDETGIVIKNKARLVAQGYNIQTGIGDYEDPLLQLQD